MAEELRSEFSFFPSTSEESCSTQQVVHYRKKKDEVADNGDNDDSSDAVSSVDENLEIVSVASSVDDRLSCRGRLQVVIHSLPIQIFVLTLVVIDAITVLCELLLDVGAFNNRECYGRNKTEQADFCHYDVSFRSFCPPSPIVMNVGENLTAGNGRDYCLCDYRKGRYTCAIAIGGMRDAGIDPASILHKFSLVILTIFIVEIFLKLVAFRLKYFTHKFEVFDAIVVLIAWILDVSSLAQEEAFFQLGALIIGLRLWRVVRIVNGGVLSAKTRSDKQLQGAKSYAKIIVHALHKAQKKLLKQQDKINELTGILDQNNIPLPKKQPPNDVPVYPYDKEEGIHFN